VNNSVPGLHGRNYSSFKIMPKGIRLSVIIMQEKNGASAINCAFDIRRTYINSKGKGRNVISFLVLSGSLQSAHNSIILKGNRNSIPTIVGSCVLRY
jgi:hypothetical protein